MKGLFKKQFTFILYGCVFWLPIALVIYLAVLLFSNADKIWSVILGAGITDKYLYFPLGIILWILIVYFTGMILKLTKLGKVLSKIPVLGLFFGQGEMMSIGRLSHMQPCLFLSSPTCISYCWILSEEKVTVNEDNATFSIINVYGPDVPALVMGRVFAARKDSIMKLANSSPEIINLLFYAVRSPAALKYIPWEDESREEFEERSKFFGLRKNSE